MSVDFLDKLSTADPLPGHLMATFLVALIGGAIGLVAGFIAGMFIAAAAHMSSFEGAPE